MSKSDLKPDKLEFEIGAYMADSYKIEWRGDGLALEAVYSHGYFGDDNLIRPDKEKWNRFWKEMEGINVWDWASEYSAAVCDGTSWSLKLEYNNKAIDTYGHMAYPDPDDVSKIEVSKPFEDLVKALNRLCGYDHISV